MGMLGDFADMFIGPETQGYANTINDYGNDVISAANNLNPDSLTSAFQGISTDPSTRQAQMQALSQLSSIANQGGLDPQSRAALFQAQASQEGTEQAQRAAALNRLAAQGQGNSGATINALMAAQQGGANREAMAGVQAAGDARTRAMQALGQMGSMAGNIRGQDWNQAAQRASALDEMNRARYEGNLGKYNALRNAYGFGKDIQNENIGRTASQIGSYGKFMDDMNQTGMSMMGGGMGGGMGGMMGSGGGGMMSGLGGYGQLASLAGSQNSPGKDNMEEWYGGGGGY